MLLWEHPTHVYMYACSFKGMGGIRNLHLQILVAKLQNEKDTISLDASS